MREVPVARARNELTRLVHEAEEGEVVRITRRGNPVAALVSSDACEGLEARDTKRDVWRAIEDWRTQASFDWPELTHEEVNDRRDQHPGREPSWPD